MKKAVFLITLIFTMSTSYSQNFNLDWRVQYNNDSTTNMSHTTNIVSDAAGNFYISAMNFITYSGQLLKKIDENGNQLFLKTITIPDCFIWADTMVIDDSANIYIGGFIQGAGFDAFVVKFDSSGNLLWLDSLESPMMRSSKLSSFSIDREHNIFATGTAELDTLGTSGMFTAKILNSGYISWVRVDTTTYMPVFINAKQNRISILQTEMYNLLSMQMDTSGTILSSDTSALIELQNGRLFTSTDSAGNIFTAVPDDVNVMKLIHWDFYGNKIWEKTFPGLIPGAILAVDSSIYCVVSDFSGTYGESLLKLNYYGDTLWRKTFGSAYVFYEYQIINFTHNKLFISRTTGGPTAIEISSLDTSGILLNSDTITEGNRWIIATDVAINSSGKLIQIGYTQYQSDYKFLIAGFDSTLQEIFRNSAKDYFDGNDIATHAILDYSNNLIVIGETNGYNGFFEIQVLKYSETGNLIWTRKYSFVHDVITSIKDFTKDADNSIWFCGKSYNDTTYRNRGYAFKIDSLGNILINYIDTPNTVDEFSKIEFDQSGKTYLGGHSDITTQSFITTFDSNNNLTGTTIILQNAVSSTLADFRLHDNSYYILNNIHTFPLTGNDLLLQKSDLAGIESWHIRLSNTLQSSHYNYAKIHLTSDDKIICYGNKDTLTRSQSYLVAVDTLGNLLWENYDHGSLFHTTGICDLVSDTSGNLYFTGECNSTLGFSQWYVAAVNENGVQLWADSSSANSRAGSIAINNGLIYVSGFDTLDEKIANKLLIYDLNGSPVYQYSLPVNLTKEPIDKVLVDTTGNCYYINNFRDPYNTEDISITNFNIIPDFINELKGESIFSFPNPASNFIYISFPEIKNSEDIHVYSNLGIQVRHKVDISISQSGAYVNISKLMTGNYFFTIRKGIKIYSGSFVKVDW